MQALEFGGGAQARVIEIDQAPPASGWARVRVHYNSVCGSDLWLYEGKWHGNRYPIVPGHEWSGIVTEVGDTGREWIGRPVIGDLIHACGVCDPCRDGLPVMCESLTEVGFTVNGGCAEYVDVPVANLYAVPDGLSLAAACQTEPLSVALHAVARAALRPGERVAVLGCGGIGLLIAQAAHAAGAVVELATDPVAFRRGVAERIGVAQAVEPGSEQIQAVRGKGFDAVFEASGAPDSAVGALELVRPGGRVVLVGYRVGATHPIETAKLPLAYATMIGVMGPGGKYRDALNLLARGAVDAEPLLTDFVKLDEHGPALRRALDKADGTIRVVFDLAGADGA
ncbi:2-desacetyl-2-hydroxyethyl bacteriochlorophyllide A dehydrogenase [Catenulispora sp. GP43]|uniref:zinc-dependent alcohol dehydrogenase n=1 Tax=Catenulispora sp. GP43 TaxID=3156263 RepID=UPI003513F726